MGSHASHHLKNNPPKGRIPKRWDKNLVQEILPEGRIIDRILLIEGYLHISTFYSEGDIYLGPTAMVSNQILMQLCHLAHTCVIKAPSDIANNIQSAQLPTVMKHAEDILRIIHTIIPENAVDPQQIIPVSIPKTIDPVQASVGKPLRQCSACQQWGHTSKLTIFLFFLPF